MIPVYAIILYFFVGFGIGTLACSRVTKEYAEAKPALAIFSFFLWPFLTLFLAIVSIGGLIIKASRLIEKKP